MKLSVDADARVAGYSLMPREWQRKPAERSDVTIRRRLSVT